MSIKGNGMVSDWLKINGILHDGVLKEIASFGTYEERMSEPFGTYEEGQQLIDWEWFLDNKDVPYKKEIYKRWKERQELND